jgi:hypothetical protein
VGRQPACALNNLGQAVGHSELSNVPFGPFHAFLWPGPDGKMQELKPLPEDHISAALGINDQSQVVRTSISDDFNFTAVIWTNGAIADLNALVTANPAGLTLVIAESANSAGEIVGYGVAGDGLHLFLASPNRGQNFSRLGASCSQANAERFHAQTAPPAHRHSRQVNAALICLRFAPALVGAKRAACGIAPPVGSAQCGVSPFGVPKNRHIVGILP